MNHLKVFSKAQTCTIEDKVVSGKEDVIQTLPFLLLT